MLSIVGSSGAGKTTICKAIMGLLGSTYKATGEVWFQGKNLLSLSKKECQKIYGKEICFIMQNPMTAFNPSLRVGKQLEKTFYSTMRVLQKMKCFLYSIKHYVN